MAASATAWGGMPMNIFISGGGRVGFHLARLLSEDDHDVTLIEQNRDLLERIDYSLDVHTVHGNAADALLLKSAGAGNADLVVAATGQDETNLVTATTAKGLGAKQVVARVHHPMYSESSILYETIMGIDFLISPEAITASEIATYIEHRGIVASESFGRGHVQMVQMRVSTTPLAEGQTIKDLPLPKGILLGMITRGGNVEIPSGASTIKRHDLVTVIGHKEQMEQTKRMFIADDDKNEKIIIMGGGSVGEYLAQILEKRGLSVKLFDRNLSRCHELARVLKKTKVVCRDGTTRMSLEQEHVAGADMFVASTGDDERNIMGCLLAKEVGAQEVLAVVHQPDFAPLVGRLGIDHAVTPRACLANRILKLVNIHRTASLALLEEGQVEVSEFKMKVGNNLLGRPLAKIELPKHCLIATILRGERVIVPRGNDEILAEDSVIVIAHSDKAQAVQRLFGS